VTLSDWVGTAGVACLLAAYFANARGLLASGAVAYPLLNAVGAALACWASFQIRFVPFVVLEAIWCAVACAELRRTLLLAKQT
jgi:hypothetical protein